MKNTERKFNIGDLAYEFSSQDKSTVLTPRIVQEIGFKQSIVQNDLTMEREEILIPIIKTEGKDFQPENLFYKEEELPNIIIQKVSASRYF